MKDYAYVSADGSPEDINSLMASGQLAFDVEGTGVNVGTSLPLGFSLAHSLTGAYYATIDNQFFKDLLADQHRLKIAHNAIYDRSMMKKGGVIIDRLCCTMIAAHLLEEDRLSLKAQALKHLNLDVRSFKELGRSFDLMTIEEMAEYSGPHSASALALWEIYEERMKRLKLLDVFWNIEMPLVPVLSDMELNGVMVDSNVLRDIGGRLDVRIAALGDALNYWCGTSNVNFNSPDQVAKVFYDKLGLPQHWAKTKSGRSTIGAPYLETIKGKHPAIPIYLMFKQFKTLKNSYVNSLATQIEDDGRVYGSFNQTRTRTGRLSSSDPNLQKIPKRRPEGKLIRRAFVAPEGKVLLKADYDLLELKKMAICSKDSLLLQAFKDERDIHTETAIKLYGDPKFRSKGKTADFQIIYLGGDKKTREALEKAYPEVFAWTKQTTLQAREAGYVRTVGGRIRVIPEYSPPRGRPMSMKALEHGDREVISTIVQGSSAEDVKVGMVNIWREVRDSDIKMLLQVHDELVFEVPYNQVDDLAQLVKDKMTINDYEIPLTLSIEVGNNWGEMHEWTKSSRRYR